MNRCSICDNELEHDDIQGFFGEDEVGFCPWCYSAIVDMVFCHHGIERDALDDVED